MISVIVCSVNKTQFYKLSENILNTIGIEYELICIDNSNDKFSIAQAYNKGAEQAKFPYLCFVHEDVLFKTLEWGGNIINHFKSDEETGLIGIAGGIYKSKMSSAWWQTDMIDIEVKRMNVVQFYKDSLRNSIHFFINPFNENKAEVVALDGVFLAMTKGVWNENKYDEKLLKKFHGYDLDISLSIKQKRKLFVVYDILLEHYSPGIIDLNWMIEIIKVHKKWKKQLPQLVGERGINIGCVYKDSWSRLKKNITFLIGQKTSLVFLIKQYFLLLTLVDGCPNLLSYYKDSFIQFVKIIRLYKREKNIT